MKRFFTILLLACLPAAYAQQATSPVSSYYSSMNLADDWEQVRRIKSNKMLVRETFTQRYAPKSIKCDLDILARAKNYASNPRMKGQDMGWMFETFVKNKYKKAQYVQSSTARLNDITSRLGKNFYNAQLKVHKSGNPRTYIRDMGKGYNSLFIIPDDHVKALKDELKKMASERDTLKAMKAAGGITPAQEKQLTKLINFNIESKLSRVRGGGITYKNLEIKLDRGVASLGKIAGKGGNAATGATIGASAAKRIAQRAGGAIGLALATYELYSIYAQYKNHGMTDRQFKQRLSSTSAGMAGATAGAYIAGAATSFSGPGAIVVGAIGGTIGYFVGSMATEASINYYYTRLKEKEKAELRDYLLQCYRSN